MSMANDFGEVKILQLLNRIERRQGKLQQATDARVARQSLIRRIAECAVGGKVAVWEAGMDCDCVQYSGYRGIIDATVAAFDAEFDHAHKWADGPVSLWVESPLKQREWNSRDLVLEAFEDGHPHSVRP